MIGWHGDPFDRDDMGERRARMRLGTWRSTAGDRLRAAGAMGARRSCVPGWHEMAGISDLAGSEFGRRCWVRWAAWHEIGDGD